MSEAQDVAIFRLVPVDAAARVLSRELVDEPRCIAVRIGLIDIRESRIRERREVESQRLTTAVQLRLRPRETLARRAPHDGVQKTVSAWRFRAGRCLLL